MKTYLEFSGESSSNKSGTSAKFWEAWTEGSDLHIHFGKIGSPKGQKSVKHFDSVLDATDAFFRAIDQKLKKGYVEVQIPNSLENSTAHSADEAASTHNFPMAFNDVNPEIVAANADYCEWSDKYTPRIFVNTEGFESEIPHWVNQDYLWALKTWASDDRTWSFLEPGGSQNEDSEGFVICSAPFNTDNDEWPQITVGLFRRCLRCDETGVAEGTRCPDCQGSGEQDFQIEEFANMISADNWDDAAQQLSDGLELGSTNVHKTVNFCSTCGGKRATLTAKYCGNCGEKFA